MKKMNKLILATLLCLIVSLSVYAEKEITILFTHDIHSFIEPLREENGSLVGGFARLSSAIEEIKHNTEGPLLQVDGGDFSMGTMYQSMYTKAAIELRLLGSLGVEFTTFGNHEFDFRDDGLFKMLNAAKTSQDRLPQILSSNLDFSQYNQGENAEGLSLVTEYVIIEKEGIRIGLFGLMGKDSLACSPLTKIPFADPIETAKKVVTQLKKEDVDLIICLSHSGTWLDNPKISEDELLAKKVPEIDLIISGHTHSFFKEPLVYGNTFIVSNGEYTKYLGKMRLVQTENKRWKNQEYKLIPMDDSIKADPKMEKTIERYASLINEYTQMFGFKSRDEILTYNPYVWPSQKHMENHYEDHPFAQLITDSYRYAVNEALGFTPDIGVEAIGVIRSVLPPGEVSVSDVYQCLSLGVGEDGISGYPLGIAYLTGKELQNLAEVDASVSKIMMGAQLYTSGLEYTINPSRLILNRVTNVQIIKPDGTKEKVEKDKLYSVVSGLYDLQMLGAVKEQSFGLLSIVPKDKNGNPIEEDKDIIIHTSEGKEIKQWYALADFLQRFESVPATYEKAPVHKIILDSKNIIELVKEPNKIGYIVDSIVVVIFVLLIGTGVLIVSRIKKRKGK